MKQFDFNERLAFSHGISKNKDFETILFSQIPGAKEIRKATLQEDKKGTDYVVIRENGRELSIDVKVREYDWKEKTGEDDIALETWSVVGKKAGWTRDKDKNTDYVFWYWNNTGRWCLLPFVYLYTLFSEHWEEWIKNFKHASQQNNGYMSECVFVPRRFLWVEIYKRFGGN
jgi:hypothetical protein